jgi:4-amino-4-deoxy-L-arabinose transferase-like glycosyltransferase
MRLIIAAFFAVQVSIIGFAANGPFVDEGVYTVAGLRVLEGKGLSDGYAMWFNGSPFLWPVLAALGHHLGGLAGARLMAVLLSLVALVAFARTAEILFGASAAAWGTGALAVNGLVLALAHFAVYDVPGLTGVAVAMWCLCRSPSRPAHPHDPRGHHLLWVMGAALAFALAVIAKYGYLIMVLPLAGLLVSVQANGRREETCGIARAGPALALFLSASAVILAGYFWLVFGSLVPTSVSAYLEQPFRASRGHIAVLQMVYGLAPLVLAGAGAMVAWRRHSRLLVVTCLAALLVFPAFHLWTANSVSSQKHVVPGFLFAYLLAGVGLERWWNSRSRPALILGLTLLATWGALQWYWQEHSWSDNRTLAAHLVRNIRPGERVVAESAWTYILALYPAGAIASPSDVIDANHSPTIGGLDVCRIPWLVGNPGAAAMIKTAVDQCGHRRVRSWTTRHYYFDTTRLRWDSYTVAVHLYHLPQQHGAK